MAVYYGACPFWKIYVKLGNQSGNLLPEFLGSTDYESIIRFQEFLDVDLVWRMHFWKITFEYILLGFRCR